MQLVLGKKTAPWWMVQQHPLLPDKSGKTKVSNVKNAARNGAGLRSSVAPNDLARLLQNRDPRLTTLIRH